MCFKLAFSTSFHRLLWSPRLMMLRFNLPWKSDTILYGVIFPSRASFTDLQIVIVISIKLPKCLKLLSENLKVSENLTKKTKKTSKPMSVKKKRAWINSSVRAIPEALIWTEILSVESLCLMMNYHLTSSPLSMIHPSPLYSRNISSFVTWIWSVYNRSSVFSI